MIQQNKISIGVQFTFWVAYFSLLSFVFSNILPVDQAIARSAMSVGIQAAAYYFNTNFLFPQLLKNKNQWLYLINIVLSIAATVLVISLIEGKLFFNEHFEFNDEMQNWPHRFKRRLPSPNEFGHARLLFNLVSVLIVMVISISVSAIRTTAERTRKEAELKGENLENEMKFLKSQINPHFLFNSLNNIYSLSVIQSDQTPEMILKLSDMLRYVLYECNEERVLIHKEIEYIKNYIELQQLKTEQKQNVVFEVGAIDTTVSIEPMLFIPFIENSFKHSKIEDIENGWVKLALKNENGTLSFIAENSIPNEQYTKDKVGGIGLENVRRRLDLLYPNRHQLKVEQQSEKFYVELTVNIA